MPVNVVRTRGKAVRHLLPAVPRRGVGQSRGLQRGTRVTVKSVHRTTGVCVVSVLGGRDGVVAIHLEVEPRITTTCIGKTHVTTTICLQHLVSRTISRWEGICVLNSNTSIVYAKSFRESTCDNRLNVNLTVLSAVSNVKGLRLYTSVRSLSTTAVFTVEVNTTKAVIVSRSRAVTVNLNSIPVGSRRVSRRQVQAICKVSIV